MELGTVQTLNRIVKAKPINKISGRGGIVTFRRNLRASVRGLWSGALRKQQALRTFRAAIERGIERAWVEGAAECEIEAGELTVEELTIRDEFIFNQNEYAVDFIDRVQAESKANGGALTPLLQQTELWVNRYNDAQNQSKSLACADQKGEWVLGPTEKHCRSCNGFNGRVYRFSTWRANGALPQSQSLACRGYHCECQIRPTNKRVTSGKFPLRLLQ